MAKKIDPLESWQALQVVILTLSEERLQALMAEEMAGKNRRVMVLRIWMRYNKLRGQREKAELTKKTRPVRTGKAA